jgi:hypothetical protein
MEAVTSPTHSEKTNPHVKLLTGRERSAWDAILVKEGGQCNNRLALIIDRRETTNEETPL